MTFQLFTAQRSIHNPVKYPTVSAPAFPDPLPPIPSTIIMGGLNFKICQNFVGTKFFLTFMVGETSINLYGGS